MAKKEKYVPPTTGQQIAAKYSPAHVNTLGADIDAAINAKSTPIAYLLDAAIRFAGGESVKLNNVTFTQDVNDNSFYFYLGYYTTHPTELKIPANK